MKSLKEKFLHILDVRWHLPFIIAICFNFLALISSPWFLSLLQFDVLFKMIFLINILLLFFLIVSLIYQLSKKRWLRALITIVYSYLHFVISIFVIAIISVVTASETDKLTNLDPCICKNAKEGSYIMENCKNHVEFLSEDEKNKWIEEQKKCEKSDENNNRDNGSVVPN